MEVTLFCLLDTEPTLTVYDTRIDSYIESVSVRVSDIVSITVLGNGLFDASLLSTVPNVQKIRLSGVTVYNTEQLAVPSLHSVKMYKCKLDDSSHSSLIDSFIYNCPSLKELHIVSCGLEGSISPNICTLSALRSLDLSCNRLRGTVPIIRTLYNLNVSNNLLDIDSDLKSDLIQSIPKVQLHHQYTVLI